MFSITYQEDELRGMNWMDLKKGEFYKSSATADIYLCVGNYLGEKGILCLTNSQVRREHDVNVANLRHLTSGRIILTVAK